MRGRFIGPLSEDVRIVLHARKMRPIFAVFLLGVGLPLVIISLLLFLVVPSGIFFFSFYAGLFAVAWARNIWKRWRLGAGVVLLCYSALGGVTWLTMLKPGYALGAHAMDVVVRFTLLTAIAGAVLFIPAWYEERTRPTPAPLPYDQEGAAIDPGHQLPTSVEHSQTRTKER